MNSIIVNSIDDALEEAQSEILNEIEGAKDDALNEIEDAKNSALDEIETASDVRKLREKLQELQNAIERLEAAKAKKENCNEEA